MHVQRHVVSITTASDGSATAYTTLPITGRIVAIRYVKTDFTDGVDTTITVEDTAEAIVTLTNHNTTANYYPRVPVHDEAGAAATLDGTRAMRDAVHVANSRIKFVVAAGGDTKTGTFHVIVA
jgi:hypothetical protein